MTQPQETVLTDSARVCCDGATGITARGFDAAALGHPRVWLQIDETGFAECGYCDRRFVLKGGPADKAAA
jgi:NADH dehydrogenase (ubiquinone) Fe-S protein 6